MIRLLARFDEAGRRWNIAAGAYTIAVGLDAEDREQQQTVEIEASDLPPKTELKGNAAAGSHVSPVGLRGRFCCKEPFVTQANMLLALNPGFGRRFFETSYLSPLLSGKGDAA